MVNQKCKCYDNGETASSTRFCLRKVISSITQWVVMDACVSREIVHIGKPNGGGYDIDAAMQNYYFPIIECPIGECRPKCLQ